MASAVKDKLAKTRTLPIPGPETVSAVPDGYQATTGDERIGLVQRVARNLEAELLAGLQECSALGDKVTALLGEYAPSGEKATPIATELSQVRLTLAKAQELVSYLEERKALLLSDGKDYMDAVKKEYAHHEGRKPGLPSTFQQSVKFNNAAGEAITEGRADARKRKETDKEE